MRRAAGSAAERRRGGASPAAGRAAKAADTVRLNRNNQIWQAAGSTVTINSSGVLDVNGHTETIRNLTMAGGGQLIGTGISVLYIQGTVTTNASAATATINLSYPMLSAAGQVPFVIADGAAAVDLDASASLGSAVGAGTTELGAGVLFSSTGSTLDVETGTVVLRGGLTTEPGSTLGKTGDGRLIVGGAQEHGAGAVFDVLDGTVVFETDAGSEAATLTLNVTGAEVDFARNQHLDTLSIGDGGTVVFTGAHVVVLNHLVMDGIDYGAATLTPEPAALLLLAAGGLGVLVRRNRR